MPGRRLVILVRGALLAAAASLACDDSSSPERSVVAALDVVDGDEQSGIVARELADPLVVRALDEDGRPVVDAVVNFRVISGGGSVFAGAAETNADGVAQERWTLGTSTAEPQTVEVRAVNNETGAPIVYATFTATPLPDAPAAVVQVDGNGQTGPAGTRLPDSLEVRVVDDFGNVVPDAAVQWRVLTGGGAIAAGDDRTDDEGIARASWTLGGALDANQTVRAESGTATPATFVASASLPP